MKNLDTLNETLFETLQNLKDDKVDHKKAKAIVDVSAVIVKNVSLQLQAFKTLDGKIGFPDALQSKKQEVFKSLKLKDAYLQKTDFAKSLGYNNVTEAIGAMGNVGFNKRFAQEFAMAS